jgi:hypothetical protein
MDGVDMNSEQLKVIAEGMGYNAINRNGFIYCWKGDAEYNYKPSPIRIHEPPPSNAIKYYPDTTNDTQCMEIMRKLRISLHAIPHDGTWDAVKVNGKGDLVMANGKTINEAVCNAAFDYFNT